MRRLPLLLSVMAVMGLALTFNFSAPASEAGASPTMANIPINMTITCDGDGDVDEVTIRPWTVHLRIGTNDQATFRLLPAGDVDFVMIERKSGSTWPFASPAPPFRVDEGGQNAVTTGPINAPAGTYLYNIVADCGSGRTVIDPRMEIDP